MSYLATSALMLSIRLDCIYLPTTALRYSQVSQLAFCILRWDMRWATCAEPRFISSSRFLLADEAECTALRGRIASARWSFWLMSPCLPLLSFSVIFNYAKRTFQAVCGSSSTFDSICYSNLSYYWILIYRSIYTQIFVISNSILAKPTSFLSLNTVLTKHLSMFCYIHFMSTYSTPFRHRLLAFLTLVGIQRIFVATIAASPDWDGTIARPAYVLGFKVAIFASLANPFFCFLHSCISSFATEFANICSVWVNLRTGLADPLIFFYFLRIISLVYLSRFSTYLSYIHIKWWILSSAVCTVPPCALKIAHLTDVFGNVIFNSALVADPEVPV